MSPEAIVEEEEALLARARDALSAADARPSEEGLRAVDELRALRDQALETSDDDLPGVLHEMGMRQRLRERTPDAARPDPDAPYVAHLRIDDGRGPRDYLLGKASFFDVRAGVRIVDWRTAPIARVFYRYREGDEIEEEIGERTLTGHVLARRVVVIERGVLTRILGDEMAIARRADGSWGPDDGLALAPGGSGTAPRALGVGIGARHRAAKADVTALLDAEQHAAIATPGSTPLLVIGSAGSGKTTVALHRFARLAASEPARYPADRMRVVVPEEGLARLSRRLLAPLGVHDAQVANLDQWAIAAARAVYGSLPRITDEAPAVVIRLKRHPALYDVLRARVAGRMPADRARTIPRVRRALGSLLADRAVLAEVIDAAGGDLPRYSIEDTVRHTMRQLADSPEKELASITDEHMKTALDGREVWDGTPDAIAGSLDVEDLPLFLAMRAWAGISDRAELAHLVVDEAEDVSLFELDVLGRSLVSPRSLTLAGDDAQQTESGFGGWDRALAVAGARGAASVRLSVSYRCPRPIVELAQRVLGDRAVLDVRAAREGAPVAIHAFPDEAHAWIVLATALRDLVEREPAAQIAVIARDRDAARRVHAALEDVPTARLVEDGAFSFAPGVDVTSTDEVKGLEWDYVVIPDATAAAYPDEAEPRRRLHVAITRASWQLLVLAPGRASPLVA